MKTPLRRWATQPKSWNYNALAIQESRVVIEENYNTEFYEARGEAYQKRTNPDL